MVSRGSSTICSSELGSNSLKCAKTFFNLDGRSFTTHDDSFLLKSVKYVKVSDPDFLPFYLVSVNSTWSGLKVTMSVFVTQDFKNSLLDTTAG